jgi:Family of unknown function (DUF6492)
MQTIEVVLPLKIHARVDASDLDRFSTLLLPSFDRFFSCKDRLKFLLVVPDGDLLAVTGRIQELGRSDIRVVCEDSLCPTLKGRSGWYKQQILKLAAAKLVSSNYYLVLDADIILKRPAKLQDLFPTEKPILQKVKASAQWDWWVASRKILKSNVEIKRDSIVMGVTPEFLHRETCLALQDVIASRNNTGEWDRFLFDSRHTGWTEYTLYWLYVLERGLDQQLYDWSPQKMYEGIWKYTHRLSSRHLRRIFAPDSNSFFLVVQSNINLELSFIQKRISPYLSDQDAINSGTRRGGLPSRLREYLMKILRFP